MEEDFSVPAAERATYEKTFEQLRPDKGMISGPVARECFLKSQLPNEELAQIWCGEMQGPGRSGSRRAH